MCYYNRDSNVNGLNTLSVLCYPVLSFTVCLLKKTAKTKMKNTK